MWRNQILGWDGGGACLAGWDKILAFSETLLWRALIETYLKYQEESGEDFEDTKKAIEIVSSATRDSNKGLREKEMMERMKKLQLRCEPFQLIQAGRHLLREGELHNVNNWEVAFLIILKDAFFVCRLLSLVVPSLWLTLFFWLVTR